jgi:hypothetical protein
VVEQASDVIVEPRIDDAERAGIDDAIAAAVDLLVVLVHRTEVAIAGEEVRVALRFRTRADVLLAGDLLPGLIGEVVAGHPTRREPQEVGLLERVHEVAAKMRLLPTPKDRIRRRRGRRRRLRTQCQHASRSHPDHNRGSLKHFVFPSLGSRPPARPPMSANRRGQPTPDPGEVKESPPQRADAPRQSFCAARWHSEPGGAL